MRRFARFFKYAVGFLFFLVMCRWQCRPKEKVIVRFIPVTVKMDTARKFDEESHLPFEEMLETEVTYGVATPTLAPTTVTPTSTEATSTTVSQTLTTFSLDTLFSNTDRTTNAIEAPTKVAGSDDAVSRVHVLILASFRGGSTFIGELFNANKDFFYSYEPGRTLIKCMKKFDQPFSLFRPKHIEMLDNIFRCNFTSDVMQCYASDLARSPLEKRTREVSALDQATLCSGRWPELIPQSKQCAVVQPKVLTDLCSEHKHTVIKSIRLYDLNDVVALVRDPSLNLKVIHIIRDPRGKAPSWMERRLVSKPNYTVTDLTGKVLESMTAYCQNALENLLVGLSMPNWLKDRYKAVRYEDVAMRPYEMTQEIYRFVGLPVPNTVLQWVHNNTNNTAGGPFSTTRNSAEAAMAWKQTLSPDAIQKIEETYPCKEMMAIAGYRPVFDVKELEDSNVTFLDTFPPQYVPNLKYREDQFHPLFWVP
ncbi:carbohydrate sulfotransferase 1-like [Ptychodera flava]|uniref:carbohydrate sulfotransferase 1-like n=1 Tax=Ptychodera flava TaxID=63121 RepID=UPI00396A7F2B